jgi:uncharacterized protein
VPHVFTNVIKPTHICNIACRYCYNEDTRAPFMTEATLERVIEGTFAISPGSGRAARHDFIWHGGEPLVARIPFYQKAVELQRLHAAGQTYHNTVQTNGLLIDEAWVEFFKAERFQVSISIDGPRHLNDMTRVDKRGRGTFDRLQRSFALLRANDIKFGVCVVLTRANKDHAEEIFDFLQSERLPFNVIPLTLSGSARPNFGELGLAPEEYAEPWIRMFDRWFDSNREDYVYCSDFAFKTQAILMGRPADCIGQKVCSNHHVSTDPDGYVYPCATLSGNPEWSYGNVNEAPLAELIDSPVALRARQRAVDPQCAQCRWQHVCHGGCMQRAYKFTGDHNQRDYYCPSLFRMYEHVAARLREDGTMDLSALPPARPAPAAHA